MSTDGPTPHRTSASSRLTQDATAMTKNGAQSTGPKTARKSMATTVAAVTMAAAAVLGAPGLVSGPSSNVDPASIIGSPPNSTASRIAGVQEDMHRAVELRQVTVEQAAFLEKQLVRRIQASTEET